MSILTLNNVSKSIGTRTLFSGFSLTVNDRDRIGIVGANGTGKTTLLEIVAGNAGHDTGDISLRKGAVIGYLRQELASGAGATLLQTVVRKAAGTQTLEERKTWIHEQLAETNDTNEQAELLEELGELETRFERLGGYSIEYEAKSILGGLGFGENDFDKPMESFSGGWRMRAGLARLLLECPDILMLDEPTNHLDIESIRWFEKYLLTYRGAVLIISHDRYFLNRAATSILAFHPDGVKRYSGGFNEYRAQREKELETLEATIENRERFVESQMRFIERFRAKNTKASQVQSRIKRLEKLEDIPAPTAEKTVAFSAPPSPRSGKMVLSVDHVRFGYGDAPVYDDVSLVLTRGQKTAIVGPNGTGKTTLLKLLAGILSPLAGEIKTGYKVQLVYYAQHQLEQLRADRTVLDELRSVAAGESDEYLRTFLGSFLFSGDDVFKKVGVLSGGEKARLSLAKLFLHPANCILMDEPTNHLDMQSRDILAEALESYDGTLCLVTHDRELIDRTAETIFEVHNGAIREFPGNYSDYSEWKRREEENTSPRAAMSASFMNHDPTTPREREKDRKRREAELRNRFHRETKRLRGRLERVEQRLSAKEKRMREIESQLEVPESFGSRDDFNSAIGEYEHLQNEKSVLDDEWLELSLEIEGIRERLDGGSGILYG